MNELDHLRTFLAVYRAGTVTRAAAQLAITQPAASGHIKALEARLKRKLFKRAGRGIEPTAAANSLARAIAAHLDGLEGAMAATMMRQDDLAGTVRLGGPAEFLTSKVLPALTTLPELGIRLEVHFGLARELVEHLDAGMLDLAIASVRIPRRSIGYQQLYREEFVLVGTPKWAGAAPGETGPLDGKALGALPWLAYDPDFSIIRRYFREVFREAPPSEAVQIIPDLRVLMDSCVAGLGVTVLPSYLCLSQIERGLIAPLHSPPAFPANDIFLAWNRSGLRQPRSMFVRDLILEAARDWRASIVPSVKAAR